MRVSQKGAGNLLKASIAPVDLDGLLPLGLGSFVLVELPLGVGHDLAAVDVGSLDEVLGRVAAPFVDGALDRLGLGFGRVATGKDGLVVRLLVKARELHLHQARHVGLDGLFHSDTHLG